MLAERKPRWDIPVPRPYQSIYDIKPERLDHHSGDVPRSERTLTYAQRWALKEQNRIGPREKGTRIVVDPIQLPSRSTINSGGAVDKVLKSLALT